MQEILTAGFSGTQVESDGGSAPIPLFSAHRTQGVRHLRSAMKEPLQERAGRSGEMVQKRESGPFLELELSHQEQALWCYMKPNGAPSFTPSMVRELNRMANWLRQGSELGEMELPRYFVMGSRLRGVYNLGGDLAFLVDRIRAGDAAALTAYAHGCVDAVHAIYSGFEQPIISIGLVEGNALGGGLEGALCFHTLVAERGVKMGFPEVLFGSFPGMGAYSFLSRKIGQNEAAKMILTGQMYTSEDFFEMGVVDVLAPAGGGRLAVQQWITENNRRHRLIHAVNRVRHRVNPISLRELRDVTDLWVETALLLDTSDLRRMERLVAAQRRNAR